VREFPPALVTIKLSRGCCRAIADQLEPSIKLVVDRDASSFNDGLGPITKMIDAVCEVAVASRPDQRHRCEFTFASGKKFDARHRSRAEALVLREGIKLGLKKDTTDATRRTLRARLALLDRLLDTPVVDRIAALNEEDR